MVCIVIHYHLQVVNLMHVGTRRSVNVHGEISVKVCLDRKET